MPGTTALRRGDKRLARAYWLPVWLRTFKSQVQGDSVSEESVENDRKIPRHPLLACMCKGIYILTHIFV